MDVETRYIALFKRGEIVGFAWVEARDFETVNEHRWTSGHPPNSKSSYAYRSRWNGKRTVTVQMHRQLCEGPEVDHINGDGLDNRRSNLRPCTRSQNMANRGRQRNNTSGYKGVSRSGRKWCARIYAPNPNGGRSRALTLGRFDSPEEAHAAYCEAAKRLHGEFARTA
jgi:hypothetical protein